MLIKFSLSTQFLTCFYDYFLFFQFGKRNLFISSLHLEINPQLSPIPMFLYSFFPRVSQEKNNRKYLPNCPKSIYTTDRHTHPKKNSMWRFNVLWRKKGKFCKDPPLDNKTSKYELIVHNSLEEKTKLPNKCIPPVGFSI